MADMDKTGELAALLEDVDDLEAVIRAVAREQAIRQGMVETGEDRATIADFLDAHISMDQEAVLDLTDGEPTTLDAGLQRYVEELAATEPDSVDAALMAQGIAGELETLLAYPWPVPDRS